VPAEARTRDAADLMQQLARYGVPVEVIEAPACDDIVRTLASVRVAA
jgi:hypothetical protein